MGKTLIAVGAALTLWTCAGPIAGGEADDPAATNPGGKTDTVGGDGAGGATLDVDGGAADLGREGADADGEVADGDGDGSVGEVGGDAETMVDPYAQALDVHLHRVAFPEGTPASGYRRPRVDTGFSLGGTEFWQRWPGGLMPTYSYSEGTEWGQRCMFASARRFETIMADPPPGLVVLRERANWRGSFFNWNDDYSQSESADGRSARLWAWRTHLIKWISQTNQDGSCFLPTYAMVEAIAETCLARADRNDGEIQGCRAP